MGRGNTVDETQFRKNLSESLGIHLPVTIYCDDNAYPSHLRQPLNPKYSDVPQWIEATKRLQFDDLIEAVAKEYDSLPDRQARNIFLTELIERVEAVTPPIFRAGWTE